jgi:hypothetical protein
VVSFTVPYNGGLDPAGTSTKFVSLKFGYQFWDFKSQGQIWTDLAFVFWGTVQAFNVGGCYLGILKGQAYGGPQLSHSSQRYAACFLFTFSSVTLHKGTHPPTSCKCEGWRVAEAEQRVMEGPVERNGQGHGFNWELASSTEDPVEDGRSSKELQPVEEQGRKTVLKC